MKVRELIELLEGCDPEATVLLATQQHYPWESDVLGLSVRGEICDQDGVAPQPATNAAPTDVLLLEGAQVRYGDRDAWRSRRR